tara:strand:- start:1556 stop:1810 length:255 start_codon:yes stop_codon:yes gene_type:complete
MNFLVFSPLPILSNPEFKVKKLDGTNVQGKLVSKNEKAISLKQYGRLQKIPKEDISSIKKRKFSLIKTSVVAIPIIAFGLYDYK